MPRLALLALALAALAALPVGVGRAQTARAPSAGSQNVQQLQALAAERTALEGTLAKTKKELEAAKSQLAAVTRERDQLRGKVTGSEAAASHAKEASELLEQNLTQTKARLEELIARFRETGSTLKVVETDKVKLKSELAVAYRDLETCRNDNAELYVVATDVLNRYEATGLLRKAALSEPITRIARNRLEDLVDAYRDRVAKARSLAPGASKVAPQARTQRPAGGAATATAGPPSPP
jgi:chromosome segregation ATPase